MFFDFELLRRQGSGRLPIVWIAATRGVQFLSKKQITSLDVVKVCEDILEFLSSQSTRPKRRLSLSLSAKLVNGTVKVYRQQVILLNQAIFTFQCTVHFHTEEDVELTGVEVSPVLKERTKRKRKVVLSPDGGHLQEVPRDVRAEITLPEPEVSARRSIFEEIRSPVEEDLGRLTAEEVALIYKAGLPSEVSVVQEEIRLPDSTIPEPEAIPELRVHREPVVEIPAPEMEEVEERPAKRRLTDLHVPTMRGISEVTVSEEIAAPQIVPAKEVAPLIEVVPPVEVIPTIEAVPLTEIGVPEEEMIQEPQIQVVPEIAPRELVKVVVKKSKAYLQPKTRHVRRINVSDEDARKIFDIDAYLMRVVLTGTKPKTNVALLEVLYPFFDQAEMREWDRSKEGTRSTVPSARPTGGRLTPVESGEAFSSGKSTLVTPTAAPPGRPSSLIPELELQVLPEEPPMAVPKEPFKDSEESAKEISVMLPPEGPEELLKKTPKRKRKPTEMARDLTVEETLPPAARRRIMSPEKLIMAEEASIRSPEQVVPRPEAVEPVADLGITKQSVLKAIVNWDFGVKDLYIEDLCKPQVTRYKIALTFNILLDLSKNQYVALNSQPDSIELGKIGKGSKMKF